MTRVVAIEPRLPVADLQRAQAFYRKLGFRCVDDPGDHADFLVLQRDAIGLQLIVADAHHPAGSITLWLAVEDAQEEYDRLDASMSVEWGPEDFGYGRREFAVLDPDGHRLIISSPTG